MCVLFLAHRVPQYPLISIFANRDESLARPSIPPALCDGPPAHVAPRDRQAGGTWLGINAHGLAAVITNRRPNSPDPNLRSRGHIVLAALAERDVDGAVRRIEQDLGRHPTNAFNLIVTTGREAAWLRWTGRFDSVEIEAGLHTLTNDHDLDELEWRQPVGSRAGADGETGPLPIAPHHPLLKVLTDHRSLYHEYDICKHGRGYGTVSSTILLSSGPGAPAGYLGYAEGPPCKNSYRDYSVLLERLFTPGA